MITFERGFRRFNFCVAAVAIHQCHVLLHPLERDDFRTLPGGGVATGERRYAGARPC